MSNNNHNGKLLYLIIGTVLAVLSSVITTIVTKEYEEQQKRKVLLYKITKNEYRTIPDKEMIENIKRRNVGYKISYDGREAANFTIVFMTDTEKGYSIKDIDYSDVQPKELPPDITEAFDSKGRFYVRDLRGGQEINFDIKVESKNPIPSDVVKLMILKADTNLSIKKLNWGYYVNKWHLPLIIISIAVILFFALVILILRLLYVKIVKNS